MRLQGREITPTRASALALRDEQRLVKEGYEFLDEKRVLLAGELLRQLALHRAAAERRERLAKSAAETLRAAIERHGLEELSVYPPPDGEATTEVARRDRRFLGLPLIETSLPEREEPAAPERPAKPVFPSAAAVECATAFRRLAGVQVELAGLETNLRRMMRDYRATERRARALENVLLPEIAAAIKEIDEHLEAIEQEEALLVRHVGKTRQG